MHQRISAVVSAYIATMSQAQKRVICGALSHLLGARTEQYIFADGDRLITHSELQNALFSINEKSEHRKNKGVYYTPEDVCRYIICNASLLLLDREQCRTYPRGDALARITGHPRDAVEPLLYQKKFFDPTCGSGEFLIQAFKIKLEILQVIKPDYTDKDLYLIAKTIYGNDTDEDSTDISKLRLFFEICRYLRSLRYCALVAKALQRQLSNVDYVIYEGQFDRTFDCIVGNPPYVEYGKYERREELRGGYGNIYADVMKNSMTALKRGGVFGFIVPLSYGSTARMSAIREAVMGATERQFLLSFADRPDCLFSGVHQKLNIVIARQGSGEHRLFTSNYRHWYKEERAGLLDGCDVSENRLYGSAFVPKIGNSREADIYQKVITSGKDNLLDRQTKDGTPLYLNMRGCFWIKAFTFHPGSHEYKLFRYGECYPLVYCILNSSLFWLYWTMVSDCWHITAKDLRGFYLPRIEPALYQELAVLSAALEDKLESTKKFIGTKQVDYEYKHKACKAEIDRIDECLARIYELSAEQTNYIKAYALKYRLGSGADGEND